MAINRENTLKRIYEILDYIKNDRLISLLKDGENNYSDDELEDIRDFLENGELNSINVIIDKKIEEYKHILHEIRVGKNKQKIKDLSIDENIEKLQDEKSLNNLLNF